MVRFHNVYGPRGTWFGGAKKLRPDMPKVIEATISGKPEIEIWGSGNQTRRFMFIDDCTEGIRKIMDSEILEPINLGSSEAVTINQLVDINEAIAGIKLKLRYDLSAPKGVNGRNSDNMLIKKYLEWEPGTPPNGTLAYPARLFRVMSNDFHQEDFRGFACDSIRVCPEESCETFLKNGANFLQKTRSRVLPGCSDQQRAETKE